jgi:hypothetical protein
VAESAASVSAATAAAAPSASAVADAAASMAPPPPPPPADVPDIPPSAPPPPESVVSETLESVDGRDQSQLTDVDHSSNRPTGGPGERESGNPTDAASAHAVASTLSTPARQQAQQQVAGPNSRAVAAPPPAGATPPVSAFAAAAPSAAAVLRPFLPTDLTMVEVPVLRPMQSSQQLTQSSLSRATSQGSSGTLSPRGGQQHHYQQQQQQRPQSVQGSVHGSVHGSPTHRHQPLSHIAHLTGRNTPLESPRATQDFSEPQPHHQQQLLLPAGPSGAVSPRSTMSAFAGSGRASPVLSPASSYGGQRGGPGHTEGMATPRSTSESLSSHMRTSTGQPLRPMSPLMTNLMARQYSAGMQAARSHGGGEGGSRPMSPVAHQDISLVHGIAHGSARSDAIPEDAPLTMLPDPMAMGHLGGSGAATAVPHGAADVQLEFRPHSRTRRAPHPLSHSVPPAATQSAVPRSASVTSPLQEGVLRASLGSNSPLPRPETVMALVGAAAPAPATTGMRNSTPGGVEAAPAAVATATAGMHSPTPGERGQRSGRRMSADVGQGGPSSALLQTSSSHGAQQQQQRRTGSNGISDEVLPLQLLLQVHRHLQVQVQVQRYMQVQVQPPPLSAIHRAVLCPHAPPWFPQTA